MLADGSGEYWWPGNRIGVVGDGGEPLGQAAVHLVGVAARKIGAAAAVEEQRVAGDEPAVDEEALAARRVARACAGA